MTWTTCNNFQSWQKLQSQSLSYKGREKSYLFQGTAYAVFCHFKTLLETSVTLRWIHSLIRSHHFYYLENVFCFVFYFCFSGWHHQVINLVSLLSQQDKIVLWRKFSPLSLNPFLVKQTRKFGLWYMMVHRRYDRGRGDISDSHPFLLGFLLLALSHYITKC